MDKNCRIYILCFSVFLFLIFFGSSFSGFSLSDLSSTSKKEIIKYQPVVAGIKDVEKNDTSINIEEGIIYITVPYYWLGVDFSSNGLGVYDLIGLGEFPSIDKLLESNFFSYKRIQGFVIEEDETISNATGKVVCVGSNCERFHCEFLDELNAIDCYKNESFLKNNRYVYTDCSWIIEGHVRSTKCVYPDYIFELWLDSKLTSSKCIDGELDKYCDWKAFSSFVYGIK